MNVIFFSIFSISLLYLLFINPNLVMPTLLNGAENAVNLSIKIFVIYAVWMGILNVMKQTDIIDSLSYYFRPIVKKLFNCNNKECENLLCLNLTANMLGMGGVATPLGIDAMQLLEIDKNYNGMCMLFVITATSIQILPTTIIGLRSSLGSLTATDIFLPSLICTTISTGIAIILTKVFSR